jgi:hypothetical protein
MSLSLDLIYIEKSVRSSSKSCLEEIPSSNTVIEISDLV